MTAPTAVRRSYCLAMPRKSTIGAPPGSMTKGSRAPIFHGPHDCRIVPRPDRTNVALSRFTVSGVGRCSVWLTRKTAEMGEAAITKTCWTASGTIRRSGRTSSTGCGAGLVGGMSTSFVDVFPAVPASRGRRSPARWRPCGWLAGDHPNRFGYGYDDRPHDGLSRRRKAEHAGSPASSGPVWAVRRSTSPHREGPGARAARRRPLSRGGRLRGAIDQSVCESGTSSEIRPGGSWRPARACRTLLMNAS